MAITLRRQLGDDEKQVVLEKHGRVCFATGHPIADDENVQFDHIKAFSSNGATEIDNIAPMCETHNKKKGRLPLFDFRTRLKMEEFFSQGQALTLRHELEYLANKNEISGFGQNIVLTPQENQILVEINNVNRPYALHKCPTTGWEYFYGSIPVEYIDSDDDVDHEVGLQPRYLIFDKVFNLFRHFQRHPVLQPSIGRIRNNRILIFDGQHKIASMLWGGRTEFECKIYLDPDTGLLNQTNISAHDKFAQTRFYSSILVAKLGSQFGKQFEDYKNLDDGKTKSEAGFMAYLREEQQLTTGELNKRFRSFLYDTVISDEANKLSRLVSKGNRSSQDTPLTIDMLEKSVFSNFAYRKALDEDMTRETYKRQTELDNLVRLLNILDDEALHAWDGTKPESDGAQNRLNRMFRSKSIMSWSEILHGAVCGKLDLNDADDRARPFYRDFSDDQWQRIRTIVRRLVDWQIWSSPVGSDIDRTLADNKSAVKKFMKEKGLTTGYLMGAAE